MRRGLPFELFIGLRYMRSKGGRGFLSLLTLIAIAGMAIGVMALIVVLAVMTGFEDELRSKILGTTSHILVMEVSGRGIEDPERALGVIRGHRDVRSAAPFVLQQVMLSHGEAATGVVLRGIDPETERRELQQRVKQGNLADLGGPEATIALGRELARTLGAFVGETVVAISPRGAVTAVGTIPKMRPLRVVAIFEIGLYEYDAALAYTSIATAQQFAELGSRVSGIEVRLDRRLPRAPGLPRAGEGARVALLDTGLDGDEPEPLLRHPAREDGDVRDPHADHLRGGVRHHQPPDPHGGGEAARDRGPAVARCLVDGASCSSSWRRGC